MTGSRLAALLDQATPGPWEVVTNDANPHLRNVLVRNKAYGASGLLAPVVTPADARLIALAPGLARLLVDMADTLRPLAGRPDALTDKINALLARFAALDEKAGGA